MPTTSPDNVFYPGSSDNVAPLESSFSVMASSVQDALDKRQVYTFQGTTIQNLPVVGVRKGDLAFLTGTELYYTFNGNTWVELRTRPQPFLGAYGTLADNLSFPSGTTTAVRLVPDYVAPGLTYDSTSGSPTVRFVKNTSALEGYYSAFIQLNMNTGSGGTYRLIYVTHMTSGNSATTMGELLLTPGYQWTRISGTVITIPMRRNESIGFRFLQNSGSTSTGADGRFVIKYEGPFE